MYLSIPRRPRTEPGGSDENLVPVRQMVTVVSRTNIRYYQGALQTIMESFVNFRFDLLQHLVNMNSVQTTKKSKSESDHQECEDIESLFLTMIPNEIHYVIFKNLDVEDIMQVSLVCKETKEMVDDNTIWKSLYRKKFLYGADDDFILRYYPRDFNWREMYQTRVTVERKYLPKVIEDLAKKKHDPALLSIAGDDWKSFLRKGKLLAKYETEGWNIEEFITLAKVEQEEYKTAAVLAFTEKDKKAVADIYYYWGRCIKDLCRDKTGEARYKLLLAEEDKYRTAFSLEPSDSYILYSWAINLRFQLEFLEGEKAVDMYRESSRKYRNAMKQGYIEKYVLWGLGSLKLHMAKKHICSEQFKTAEVYLLKAEKKYKKLESIAEPEDRLTTFSLNFNYACIHSCKRKLAQQRQDQQVNAEETQRCINKLVECNSSDDFKEYLTLDLLDLWYFDDFRQYDWFNKIYTSSKPKKVNASW